MEKGGCRNKTKRMHRVKYRKTASSDANTGIISSNPRSNVTYLWYFWMEYWHARIQRVNGTVHRSHFRYLSCWDAPRADAAHARAPLHTRYQDDRTAINREYRCYQCKESNRMKHIIYLCRQLLVKTVSSSLLERGSFPGIRCRYNCAETVTTVSLFPWTAHFPRSLPLQTRWTNCSA